MSHLIRNLVIRANRPHTREDLLKQENRVNMMLYGAHSIREFWEPLSFRLDVPQSPFENGAVEGWQGILRAGQEGPPLRCGASGQGTDAPGADKARQTGPRPFSNGL